jgi:hypothetical protein
MDFLYREQHSEGKTAYAVKTIAPPKGSPALARVITKHYHGEGASSLAGSAPNSMSDTTSLQASTATSLST